LGGLPEEIWGVECGGDLGTDAGDFAEFGRRLRENAGAVAEVFDQL
jgi:hypothetical protein